MWARDVLEGFRKEVGLEQSREGWLCIRGGRHHISMAELLCPNCWGSRWKPPGEVLWRKMSEVRTGLRKAIFSRKSQRRCDRYGLRVLARLV